MTSTPTANPSPDEGTKAAESEHRVIKRMLQSIGGEPEIDQLRQVVERLCEMLPEHFAGEEAPDGLYEELRQMKPGLCNALERLTRDHQTLRNELDGLCHAIVEVDRAHEALWKAKDAFVSHLVEHEATESGLVTDAYYVDLGESG